ncbi:hypothetical protein AAG570_010964 [Ranatra chinensis]|uniref:Uncharacterized protein n=1 Tax=Ranatra chinensis TaxID=642074 RepID=A0ABD0YJH7_9HEMI
MVIRGYRTSFIECPRQNKLEQSLVRIKFDYKHHIVLVVAGGQECYVCIPGEQTPAELQRQFPGEELAQCGGDLPPAKKCPDNYRGCLTQHNSKNTSLEEIYS